MIIHSKKVYWVNGQRFYNSGKGISDGRSLAIDYCLKNHFDSKDIIQFDSDTETDYYELLLERQRKGEITDLTHHRLLMILDEFDNANGDHIPKITYEADFTYKDLVSNKTIAVDVKGDPYFCDERFMVIKQLFDRKYLNKGVYLQIMCYDKSEKHWYEWHLGDKRKNSGKRLAKYKNKSKELDKTIKEMKQKSKDEKRIIELKNMQLNGTINKRQLKRLKELEEKYNA